MIEGDCLPTGGDIDMGTWTDTAQPKRGYLPIGTSYEKVSPGALHAPRNSNKGGSGTVLKAPIEPKSMANIELA